MTSADGSVVINTPEATPSYNLSSLTDGEPYTISISGVNLVGEGAQCASVTATPLGLAGPPTNLVINYDPDASNSVASGYQSVDLSFNAHAILVELTLLVILSCTVWILLLLRM